MPKQIIKKKTSVLAGHIQPALSQMPIIIKAKTELPGVQSDISAMHSPSVLNIGHRDSNEDSIKKLGSVPKNKPDWNCDACGLTNSHEEYKCCNCKKMNPSMSKDFHIRKEGSKKIERKNSEKKLAAQVPKPSNTPTNISINNPKSSKVECICYSTKDQALFRNGQCKICYRQAYPLQVPQTAEVKEKKNNLQESNFTFGGKTENNAPSSKIQSNALQSQPSIIQQSQDTSKLRAK